MNLTNKTHNSLISINAVGKMETTDTHSEEDLLQLLNEKGTNKLRLGHVIVENCVLPQHYLEFQKDIDNFEVYDSDVWICSFPRSGTTWTAEMAWLIGNNLDYEKAKLLFYKRVRFLDFCFLFHCGEDTEIKKPEMFNDVIAHTKDQSHPRFIKTHLPFQLLPKAIRNGEKHPRIIYVCRNPLDVCVSYYHHESAMCFNGTLDEYCKLFLAGKVVYGPYWENVLSFWQRRNQANILFLKYEDMKKDLSRAIRQTANFLGKIVNDEEIEILQKHLSFESMRSNLSLSDVSLRSFVRQYGAIKSPFFKSGIIGGYKKEMSQDFIELFQNWMKINLNGTELSF